MSLTAQTIGDRDGDLLPGAKLPLGGLMDECPGRNWIRARSPPAFRHSLARARRRSWAPNRSVPICFADCSTGQTVQSLRLLPTFRPLAIVRSSGPSSMAAVVLQALIPCLTRSGIAVVRMRLPFPAKSAGTQRPSRSRPGEPESRNPACPCGSSGPARPAVLWPALGRSRLPGPRSLLPDVRDAGQVRRWLRPGHPVLARPRLRGGWGDGRGSGTMRRSPCRASARSVPFVSPCRCAAGAETGCLP